MEALLTRGTTVELAMAQSVAKVGALDRHAAGFAGAGKVIAVIDTGVAPTFGGTLVGQACFAATQVGSTLVGHCGVAADQEQAFDQACFDAGVCVGQPLDPQAARPCPGPALNCQHGTAVAAVAARHDAPVGVAPDAGVYAIRVFNPTGSGADLLDIYLALAARRRHGRRRRVRHRRRSTSPSPPPSPSPGTVGRAWAPREPSYEHIFGELRDRGIAPVVSSGNDGKTSQIAFPACLPAAVSVGSTDLDDDLASFGNRGAGIDLLAPGADEASVGVPVDPLEIPGNTVGELGGDLVLRRRTSPGRSHSWTRSTRTRRSRQRTWFLQTAGVPVVEGSRDLSAAPPAALRRRCSWARCSSPGEAPVGGTPTVATGDVDGDGRADVRRPTPPGRARPHLLRRTRAGAS